MGLSAPGVQFSDVGLVNVSPFLTRKSAYCLMTLTRSALLPLEM